LKSDDDWKKVGRSNLVPAAAAAAAAADGDYVWFFSSSFRFQHLLFCDFESERITMVQKQRSP
jgi:hypothetical protein